MAIKKSEIIEKVQKYWLENGSKNKTVWAIVSYSLVNQYEIHWERKKDNYIMGAIKFNWENVSHYFMIFPDWKWGWKKPEITWSIKSKN